LERYNIKIYFVEKLETSRRAFASLPVRKPSIAMWLMLERDKADDYVMATGETYSIREPLDVVFSYHDLDFHESVKFDPEYTPPSEVDVLLGDVTKPATCTAGDTRPSSVN
jgi:GDP-D-mannose dehydratase